MLLMWRDKRDVLLLSEIYNANMMEIEKRDVRVRKPEVVVDYDEKVGGVDRSYEIITSYTLTRKIEEKGRRSIIRKYLSTS
jgi:hypothetical protein